MKWVARIFTIYAHCDIFDQPSPPVTPTWLPAPSWAHGSATPTLCCMVSRQWTSIVLKLISIDPGPVDEWKLLYSYERWKLLKLHTCYWIIAESSETYTSKLVNKIETAWRPGYFYYFYYAVNFYYYTVGNAPYVSRSEAMTCGHG